MGWPEAATLTHEWYTFGMPLRIRLTAGADDATRSPSRRDFAVLEGLSDQTSGEWASWEPREEGASSQPVLGVQRDVASLLEVAARLPSLIASSAEPEALARRDESLVEWFAGDQTTSVDLTIVLAVLGVHLSVGNFSGHVSLEGI